MAGSGVGRGGAGKVRSDGIVAGEWLRGYSDMEPCLVLSIRAPYLARVDGQETGLANAFLSVSPCVNADSCSLRFVRGVTISTPYGLCRCSCQTRLGFTVLDYGPVCGGIPLTYRGHISTPVPVVWLICVWRSGGGKMHMIVSQAAAVHMR